MANKKKKGQCIINGQTYFKKYFNGKVFYGKTEDELRQKIEKYDSLIGTSLQKTPDITIGEYINKWLSEVDGTVEKCTYSFYQYGAKAMINRIGKYKLTDSTPALLENAVKDFAKTKCKNTGDYPSQDYIKSAVTVLRRVYKVAKKEMLFQWNLAEDIEVKSLRKAKKSRHRALTQEEVTRIINFKHQLRPYCLFMLLCGLMPEETVPLTWGDISYDKERQTYYVTISKTGELISTGPTVIRNDKTKTDFRKRTLAIPFPLDKWIKDESKYHNKTELIFKNKNGEIYTKSALRHKWDSYLIDMDIYYNNKPSKHNPNRTKKDKELTIERFTQYDLRHSYCTLLCLYGNQTDPIASHLSTSIPNTCTVQH